MFRLGIESTGSFIQEQDLWFTDKSTGDCDSLFLSSRKFEASFTYESFISKWEDVLVHNEVVGIRLFGSLIKHFSCCFFWQTIFDVLSDCSRKENWLLLNDCHILFIAHRVQFLEILLTIFNTSSIWIIESFNKLNDRRLSTTTGSYKCNSSVLRNFNADFVQDLDFLLCRISELNVFQRNCSFFLSFFCHTAATGDWN